MTTVQNETVKTPDEKPLEDGRYRDSTRVNGIVISIGWDRGYEDYAIYFPQIELATGREKNVCDQLIRLSTLPEIAKVVFDYAVKHASECSDVYELYKKVEEWKKDLPYDLD